MEAPNYILSFYFSRNDTTDLIILIFNSVSLYLSFTDSYFCAKIKMFHPILGIAITLQT